MTTPNMQKEILTRDEHIASFEIAQDYRKVMVLLHQISGWGMDRKITRAGGATALGQLDKTKKELQELIELGLLKGNDDEIVDGYGDVIVTLIQSMRIAGVSFDEALAKAWNDIKDRKGEMHAGLFVKQADLDVVALSTDASEALARATNSDEVHAAIDMAKQEVSE